MADSADELIALISEAFAGVVRGDGTSEEEAAAENGWASEEEIQRARAEAADIPWEEVSRDDDLFQSFYSLFCFVNAEGFRFYLPACMVWVLRNWNSKDAADMFQWLIFALLLFGDEPSRVAKVESYSALNEPQKDAVRQFLRYAAKHSENKGDAEDAAKALERYWEKGSR